MLNEERGTVEADLAVIIDVGVEHLGLELDNGRLIGVLVVEIHLQAEGSALPNGIQGAVYNSLPLVQIVLIGDSIDALIVVLLDLLYLLQKLSLRVGRHTPRPTIIYDNLPPHPYRSVIPQSKERNHNPSILSVGLQGYVVDLAKGKLDLIVLDCIGAISIDLPEDVLQDFWLEVTEHSHHLLEIVEIDAL